MEIRPLFTVLVKTLRWVYIPLVPLCQDSGPIILYPQREENQCRLNNKIKYNLSAWLRQRGEEESRPHSSCSLLPVL